MQLSLSRNGRSRFVLLFLLFVGAVFIVRLFWLQVVQHNYYVNEANKEQISEFTLPAQRGLIYAHDGSQIVPLVLNEPVYLAYADPHEITDSQAITTAVNQIAGGNAVNNFSKGLTDKNSRYIVLAKQLTKDQATQLKSKNFAGVGFQQSEQRVYPEGSLASQLLGYVNGDGVGQYGIEQALNSQLSGTNGTLKAVTDVRQIPLVIRDDYVNEPAKDGDNLVLNVDRNIQSYAESALQQGLKDARATKGSVVIMDPMNGHVLAIANQPTYDPSKYADVKDYSVFQDGAVSVPYSPGSVMKTLVISTGLDTGAIKPDSYFDNSSGTFTVDGVVVHNVPGDPTDPHTTMQDILLHSLNTGADWVISQLGGGTINQKARDTLYDYYVNHFGLGKKTGIEQAGEQPGFVQNPDSGNGLNVIYANMGFGYGINVTSLQMAAALSSVVNGGAYYQPQLVAGVLQPDNSVKAKQPVVLRSNALSPQAAAQASALIVGARRASPKAKTDIPGGYTIGGKTGTAEVIDPNTGDYTTKEPISTFVGFGGGKTPRYVIMVKVDDSSIVNNNVSVGPAQIFTDISNWLLRYMKVDPNK